MSDVGFWDIDGTEADVRTIKVCMSCGALVWKSRVVEHRDFHDRATQPCIGEQVREKS
jgi:hypothetical protein